MVHDTHTRRRSQHYEDDMLVSDDYGCMCNNKSQENNKPKHKWVSKIHIRQMQEGSSYNLFKGNISIIDCMPLSSLLRTIKIYTSMKKS